MALYLIILGVKILITWSLNCEFKEISSWHSLGHSNPNFGWCLYGTVWMLFGTYLDYLNSNLGFPLYHGSINPNRGYHSFSVYLTSMSSYYTSSILLNSSAWSRFIHNHLFMSIHVDFLFLILFTSWSHMITLCLFVSIGFSPSSPWQVDWSNFEFQVN